MIGKIPSRVARLGAVAFALAAVFAATSSAAGAAETIYNDLETPKAGNVVSVGFEAKGARFEWPITFTVNAVGPGGTVGALLGSGSKMAKIPYRPSASPKCTGESAGAWYHMGECFNGKAFKLSLPLKIANLPSKAIITISYSTSHYGATPQGTQPCSSEPQGCPYDALNVGVQDGFTNPAGTPPTVGAFPAPDTAYVNGAPEEGWTGFQPQFEAKAR